MCDTFTLTYLSYSDQRGTQHQRSKSNQGKIKFLAKDPTCLGNGRLMEASLGFS